MRVNYGNEQTNATVSDISVGETFFADRKPVKEKGLYMKIDGNSGLVIKKCDMGSYAVNLETGQLKNFVWNTPVNKVVAEVSFPKK